MRNNDVSTRRCFACGDHIAAPTGFAHLCSECSRAAALAEAMAAFGEWGYISERLICEQGCQLSEDKRARNKLTPFAALLDHAAWSALEWHNVPDPLTTKPDEGLVERLRSDRKAVKMFRAFVTQFDGTAARDLFFPSGMEPDWKDVFTELTRLVVSLHQSWYGADAPPALEADSTGTGPTQPTNERVYPGVATEVDETDSEAGAKTMLDPPKHTEDADAFPF